MSYQKIYVAATSQHVGKTTTTLGLVSCLKDQGLNVGYCKPVGQQALTFNGLRADKDAVLFADYMNFKAKPELHSPVILGKGATSTYLDNPEQFNYSTRLLKATKILAQRHDIVVYEGTGHPGVGGVVKLSNARVAELLGAGVIMVVEAGIGSTIDALELNLSLFNQHNVPIIGVIINKAVPSKIDKVQYYVGNVLAERNIKLLGVMPFVEELGLPLMSTIVKAIGGKVLFNEHQLERKVEDIIAGSLVDREHLKKSTNLLLVVSMNRLGDALARLKNVAKTVAEADENSSPLSGVIITGKPNLSEEHINYFNEHSIPVVHSIMDTYESVIKISRIEVKINTKTPWKVKKAVQLFKEHVDLESILNHSPT